MTKCSRIGAVATATKQRAAVSVWATSVVLSLIVISGGCRKSTSPNEPEAPKIAEALVKISRVRPEGSTCLSAGTPYASRCTGTPVTGIMWVSSISWPTGYGGGGIEMKSSGEIWTAIQDFRAPAGMRLRIAASDAWLCPPVQICTGAGVGATGKGFSVNGVRLSDGELETSFTLKSDGTIQK